MTGLLKKIKKSTSKLIKNSTSRGLNRRSLCKQGHTRINVGFEDICQFEVKDNYLNHPLLKDLLRLSGPEFGYSYDGVLGIPCDVDLFKHLLHLLDSGNPRVHYMEFNDLVSDFNNNQNQRQQQPIACET